MFDPNKLLGCNYCTTLNQGVRAAYEHLRDEHPDIWNEDPGLAEEFQKNIDAGRI